MQFEKFKVMQFPREVLVGHNVLGHITEICDRYSKSRKAGIITGNITYDLAGATVESSLRASGIETEVIKTGNATTENLEKVETWAREISPGILVGVGGGSKVDITKKVAADIEIPYVSVPTSPSHDGIASPRASIRKPNQSLSETAVMPIAIIADTSVMVKAPFRYLAAGAADVISNETAVMDWKLANRLKGEEISSSAAALAEYASHELLEKINLIVPGVEDSVWMVTKQILASGTAMAIASSSRPASGSEHLFSHVLEIQGKGSAIHGEYCAMGTVVSMYLHGGNWEKIRSAFSSIKLSTKAKDYGLSDEDVINALSTAHSIRPERFTILGDTDMSHSAAERALEITGII
ncbi:MAG: NAD(P)-dependent glycerol-1-phosphate dehydrogenase [Candidatus Thermoplasmatota archaeon]|jgi:glycerol-1-phosphate dehydrogenase [NAD(P)+]|nr:NAD(P)-dependent glycerol-1-phosphate dehydrogenase [Candidatus Thermoplasmatota archaeon]MCL5785420.1 NAD(P)-dependent glycerol-1-phosphate dehydrogenase [Candidatus Thermoplasmatota archaeon]